MMKLVESDRQGPGQLDEETVVTPPRPEHRRVSVSLLLTASVLVGTVVAVYIIFPARHNELLTRSLELHREPPPLQLERPSEAELAAWAVAALDRDGRSVPWPSVTDPAARAEIIGAATISILNRKAALVRYRVAGSDMTLVVQRARDAPPRKHRRTDGDQRVVSWRKGRWTFVAVGAVDELQTWAGFVGAPL